jgi:arylsulfatase K
LDPNHQVAETDYMMGMALDALAASPAADNTWILFTSDHGEMHLEHRIVQKMSMYEGSERIPMIVVAPPSVKTARRGVVETTLVSLLDIFPTFLELAYNPGPGNLDGFSLVPLVVPSGSFMNGSFDGSSSTAAAARAAAAASRPDFVVAEFLGEEANTAQFMVRHQQWKLILYGNEPAGIFEYKPQLFDVDADPSEVHNVAAAHPAVVTKLEALLLTRIDYKAVAADVDEEGRGAVRRWMKHFNSSDLQLLLSGAYDGFDDGDWAKLNRWLNATDKMAPGAGMRHL